MTGDDHGVDVDRPRVECGYCQEELGTFTHTFKHYFLRHTWEGRLISRAF